MPGSYANCDAHEIDEAQTDVMLPLRIVLGRGPSRPHDTIREMHPPVLIRPMVSRAARQPAPRRTRSHTPVDTTDLVDTKPYRGPVREVRRKR